MLLSATVELPELFFLLRLKSVGKLIKSAQYVFLHKFFKKNTSISYIIHNFLYAFHFTIAELIYILVIDHFTRCVFLQYKLLNTLLISSLKIHLKNLTF